MVGIEAPFQNLASLRVLRKQRRWVLALVPIPADDVEVAAAPLVDLVAQALKEADAGVARSARVDEHRADPPLWLAGEV